MSSSVVPSAAKSSFTLAESPGYARGRKLPSGKVATSLWVALQPVEKVKASAEGAKVPVMTPEGKAPPPERSKTDESLRAERKNTDKVLGESKAEIEQTADELVENAREHADAVLETARTKADDKLGLEEPAAKELRAIAQERAVEDRVVEHERATADEILRVEREAQARALAALLPIERERTDRFLLTERARADDKLANRDDFMGMVSHDLRNLLSGILLSSQTLSNNASESDEGRATVAGVKRIQRYVARMNGLIGDLVDVVSLDAGKLAITPTRCDVGDLLTEAVDTFAQAASDKGISLRCEVDERALVATFDHSRMLQVVANLITNALKFTATGGAINLRGERAGPELRVSVKDSGVGIPREMLEAVFERFWQVNKNDQRGLGLGLYISRCIVEAHGGRIWAESTVGKGSCFRLAIPVEQ